MPEKTRNAGRWTEARFRSFVKGALRAASRRWPIKHDIKKEANRGRGKYLCAGYRRVKHIVPVSIRQDGKRINNVFCDHVEPVIDPEEGFVDWNTVVSRMFVEADGLQILCKTCHDTKTKDERQSRKKGS